MKKSGKTIFNLALASLIAVTILTGCQSSADKVEDARENVQDSKDKVVEAKQELSQAINDSIKQFKIEKEERISYYEKSLAEFKTKLAAEKKENIAIYEKKLAELEKNASDMKKKLEAYKEEGSDNWESFKNEFNHDMDQFGEAFKDLTTKNVK